MRGVARRAQLETLRSDSTGPRNDCAAVLLMVGSPLRCLGCVIAAQTIRSNLWEPTRGSTNFVNSRALVLVHTGYD
jgi:hypothetical protein